MRLFSLIITLLLPSLTLYAQQRELFPFKLEGYINADTGTIELSVLFFPDYFHQEIEKMQAKVENGKFTFSGYMEYPQGYTLNYGDVYNTRLFVLEPGDQTMTCNINDVGEVPKVNNNSMVEYREGYTKALAVVTAERELFDNKKDSLIRFYKNRIPVDIELDLQEELRRLYLAGDQARLMYISKNPDSYVALWNFIYLFSAFGYESIFTPTFEQFSDSLKNTYAGKVLLKNLKVASMLDYGSEFPHIQAVSIEGRELDYSTVIENKFTFIDFWYSNCAPCIRQFPHLKETFEKFKDKGLGIIGISTDRVNYEENWKKAILKYQLSWPQYWDKDGKESSKFSINKFPTNFLLDRQGNIIKKDLQPQELEQFLTENIK